jgi:hypothetical protein
MRLNSVSVNLPGLLDISVGTDILPMSWMMAAMLRVLCYLFPPGKALLQPARQTCEGIADDEIDNGNKEENFRGVYNGAVIDLCRHMSQF